MDRKPLNRYLANSEEPDEMPHNVAFHLGLHYLPRQNQSLEKEICFLEIITSDPSIYTMDHPDVIVCSFMENSIGLKFHIKIWHN